MVGALASVDDTSTDVASGTAVPDEMAADEGSTEVAVTVAVVEPPHALTHKRATVASGRSRRRTPQDYVPQLLPESSAPGLPATPAPAICGAEPTARQIVIVPARFYPASCPFSADA